MKRWKNVMLYVEEEEGITLNGKAELRDKIFHRTLVENLWTNNPFNGRAFKGTMIQAWCIKHNVEAQNIGKNLFLFRFPSKRDANTI